MPSRKTPQEKKALSYAKDRRNTFGESDKASRKAIPARKASESRKARRKANQGTSVITQLDEHSADLLESSLVHDVERVGGWRKDADEPLGEVVKRSIEARKTRIGRKLRARFNYSK